MDYKSSVGKPTGVQFGAHPLKYPAGSARPTGDQAQLDDIVRCQYDRWKAAYLKQDCGGYYVLTNGGAGANAETFITVSEGHGYGMIIAAMMAGTEPKAQENFWTTTGQPKLWTKDTVEIMVDPDGDGDNKDYYELQINPQNKQFHTNYDGYNTPKTEPNGPFGHEDWDPKMKTAVAVHGTIDKHEDKDDDKEDWDE